MRKTPKPIFLWGMTANKTCKTCKHCYQAGYGNHKYYKCELWNKCFTGSSSASDIRLKWNACGKYESEVNNNAN